MPRPARLALPLSLLAIGLSPLARSSAAPATVQDPTATTQEKAGEPEAPAAQDPLEPLGRMVGGQWRPVDVTILNEYSRYRWGAGKKSVILTAWRIAEDGLDPAVATGMLYWDPERRTIAGTMIQEAGSLREITLDVTPDRWDFHFDYYSGGQKTKMLDTFAWYDENSYGFQEFFVGETPLEWLNLRFAREPEGGSALPVMPMDEGTSERLAALERVTGNWATRTVRPDGSETAGRSVLYWGLDRSVVLFRSLEKVGEEEVPRGDGLFYFSPETTSIRFLSVGDDGSVFRGSVAPTKGGLVSEFLQVAGDGTRFEQELEFPAEPETPGFTVRLYGKQESERSLLQTTTFTPAG